MAWGSAGTQKVQSRREKDDTAHNVVFRDGGTTVDLGRFPEDDRRIAESVGCGRWDNGWRFDLKWRVVVVERQSKWIKYKLQIKQWYAIGIDSISRAWGRFFISKPSGLIRPCSGRTDSCMLQRGSTHTGFKWPVTFHRVEKECGKRACKLNHVE